MSFNPIVTFTLRQHTPHIHFQHTDRRATLRATEVKPKLDRFLISKRGGFGAIPPSWRIGAEKAQSQALDYKLRFSSPGHSAYTKKIIDQHNPKYLLTYSNVTGTAVTFHQDLLSLIRSNLPEFFATHNFGNRTSKAFGCFTIDTIDGKSPFAETDPQVFFESLLKLRSGCFYKKEADLSLERPSRDRPAESGKKILDEITGDWQAFKSGKNYHGYHKSLLMEYFCEKGVRWEKRKIKQTLSDSYPNVFGQIYFCERPDRKRRRISDCDIGDLSTDQYIRALLGLADHFEYRACNRGDSIKIHVRSKPTHEHDTDMVARFQAPVIFKVFENSIYMVPLHIPTALAKKMDGTPRKYEFIVQWKLGSEEGEKTMFTLTVPDEFKVTDFLDAKLENSSHPNFEKNKSIAELLGYKKH